MSLKARIQERLEALNLKPATASKLAGLEQTAVRMILLGRSKNPRADTIEKLAQALECRVEWLLTGEGAIAPLASSTARPAPDAPPVPIRSSMPMDVPVLGTAAGSGDGAIQMDGGAIDQVRRPPGLSNARDVYAIYVEGESMEPRFAPGALVYVSPHKPPRIGDDVVVQVQLGEGQDAPVLAYVKSLERRRGLEWVFRQYNPPRNDVTYEGRIIGVHRIYTVNELFGV